MSGVGKIAEERQTIHAGLQNCMHTGQSGAQSAQKYLEVILSSLLEWPHRMNVWAPLGGGDKAIAVERALSVQSQALLGIGCP